LYSIKRRKDGDEPNQLVIVLCDNTIKQKDDNEPNWFIVIYNPSKEEKTTMSLTSSSSFVAHQ
jgi:hypothetical protein